MKTFVAALLILFAQLAHAGVDLLTITLGGDVYQWRGTMQLLGNNGFGGAVVFVPDVTTGDTIYSNGFEPDPPGANWAILVYDPAADAVFFHRAAQCTELMLAANDGTTHSISVILTCP